MSARRTSKYSVKIRGPARRQKAPGPQDDRRIGGGRFTVPATISGYPTYTFHSYTATTPFTGLAFAANPDIPDNILLDDISVTAVPEASTIVSFGLLLALGLGAAVLARRKRAVSGI